MGENFKKIRLGQIVLTLFLFCGISYAQEYTVEKVFYGDHLTLTNGEAVHLKDTYAPEIMREEAEALLKDIVEGKRVSIIADEKRNKDGFLVAYVYLDTHIPASSEIKGLKDYHYMVMDDSWHIFVNLTLIAKGYGVIDEEKINGQYSGEFKKAFEKARDEKKGLWPQYLEELENIRLGPTHCESQEDCIAIRELCSCTDICVNKYFASEITLEYCPEEASRCTFGYDTQICNCKNNECVEGPKK